MKLLRLLASLLLVMGTPALAEAPPRLKSIEQQIQSVLAFATADVGVAAMDLTTGEYLGIRGDTAYPMASTVKIAVAANYLAQVEYGRRSLDDMIRGHTARYWMQAMMVRSDNYATDVLISNLGGPATIHTWLQQKGVTGLRVDRNIAQLLAAKRDLYDVRDSSTPRAMVELLRRIDKGTLLSPASRLHLLGLMAQCATGKNRIRGMLPMGTLVQHKTGTLNNYTSDVGIISLPNGRRIAVAFFARSGADRPRTIALAAKAIYDGFSFGLPYFGGAARGTGGYQPITSTLSVGGSGGTQR